MVVLVVTGCPAKLQRNLTFKFFGVSPGVGLGGLDSRSEGLHLLLHDSDSSTFTCHHQQQWSHRYCEQAFAAPSHNATTRRNDEWPANRAASSQLPQTPKAHPLKPKMTSAPHPPSASPPTTTNLPAHAPRSSLKVGPAVIASTTAPTMKTTPPPSSAASASSPPRPPTSPLHLAIPTTYFASPTSSANMSYSLSYRQAKHRG